MPEIVAHTGAPGLSMRPQAVYLMRMAKKTSPEMSAECSLRSRLHAQGLRFARKPRALPGRPELLLPKRKTAIFVRGCFWHGHDCEHGRAAPNFKVGAWAEKIAGNRARDRQHDAALQAAGWHVEPVWECQIAQPGFVDALAGRLRRR